MKRSNALLPLVPVCLLFSSLTLSANELPQLSRKDAANFSELINIAVQGQLSAEQTAKLDAGLTDSNQAVKALAVALLYKYEPRRREALFRDMREIFHYRLPGDAPFAPKNDFLIIEEKIKQLNPTLNKQGHSLLSYLYFREHHLRIIQPDHTHVSAATLLRTAFLKSVFQGSDVDTLTLIKRF